MGKRKSQSVFDEPCFSENYTEADPSELKADRIFSKKQSEKESEDQLIEHSVWDEPSLSSELHGSNENEHLTYAAWLEKKIKATSLAKSWLITLAVVLSAGPWAIIGALFNGYSEVRVFSAGVIIIAVFGPLTEEFIKIAIGFYVAEKRPFYFRSKYQLILCFAAGGLMFAVIENLIYLHVYIENPSEMIIAWRWSICTLMHTTATLIAGLGVTEMWCRCMKQRKRPQLHHAYPYIIAAIIFHGLYNMFAILISFYIPF
ncbi:MAG: PrsW family glutamic-type intramembrane protease [Sedimentisphaeraceae bacterium JB056]